MICKVGICVAYDWDLLKYSLPLIYKDADQICLSLDADCKSWKGNSFELDLPAFMNLVKSIDKDGKIIVQKEPFYNEYRTPIENECYQRHRMADVLNGADWYIQIDTDEFFLDFNEFLNTLKAYRNVKRSINIHGLWINLIKQTKEGYIYSVLKTPPLATNNPVYEYGRTNRFSNIYTNSFLVHLTWARNSEEVLFKLRNWGHSDEFNGLSFYKIWEILDEYNYTYVKDFHPMSKTPIPHLYYHPSKNLAELVATFNTKSYLLDSKELLSNNIWYSRIKKLVGK